MQHVNFDDDNLATRLDRMSDAERDQLAFGVVGLDDAGVVRFYSQTERSQSGRPARLSTLGLDFFRHVAPCMANEAFKGRIDQARATGDLDLEFGHVGDFSYRERRLQVRVVSAHDGGLWLCLRRA